MRAWMQLRAPVGHGERWGRTFYADSTERLIEVPLDRFAPIGVTSSARAPLAKVDSILFVPWGLAVKQGERGLADMLSKAVTDWHKNGYIQQLEKKWGIKATKFAEEMNAKYK